MNRKKLYDFKKRVDMAVIGMRYKLAGAAGTVLSVFFNPLTVLAGEEDKKETTFSFLTNNENTNTSIDGVTTQIKGLGASVYMLMMVIGAFGTVVSLIATGFCIMTNKNAQKREENKTHLVWIAVGAVLVFGAITIAGAFETFSTGISLSPAETTTVE